MYLQITKLCHLGKKLKRRLEDLERRAGTSEGTSSGGESKQASSKNSKKTQQSVPKAQKQQSTVHIAPVPPAPKRVSQSQFTPPMHADDEYLFPPLPYDERERSHTPPLFTYSTYPPPPEGVLLPPYGGQPQPQQYRPVTTAEPYPDYLTAPVPATLPPMTHFTDELKREPAFSEESGLSPYVYGSYLPGLDMNAPSPYDNSNPLVSSLRRLPPHHRPAVGNPSASSSAAPPPPYPPRR